MKKRFFALVGIITLLLNFIGCYNYREINKVTFVTSVIFDKEDDSNITVYLDCIKPYRDAGDSSDKGKRILYKGQGKTVLEAIRDVNMATGYKINLMQNRAYIFTEKAALAGIDNFIDIVNKDQEFEIKPYMFVYFGDVSKLLEVTAKDDEYLGLLLNDIVIKNSHNPRSVATNVNDYLTDNLTKGNVSILSSIELRKDVNDERVELKGGVIFQGGRLIGKVDVAEGLSYNFLTNNIKSGTLEIPNLQTKNGYITLEVLNNKTKTDATYENGVINLYKDIDVETSIAEAQGRFIVNKENIDTLISSEELRMKDYMMYTFKKYYEENVDILNIARLLEIKYPKENIDIWKEKINLNINIKIDITGTGKNKSSIQ